MGPRCAPVRQPPGGPGKGLFILAHSGGQGMRGFPHASRVSRRPSTHWHRPPHRPGVLPGGQVCGLPALCRTSSRPSTPWHRPPGQVCGTGQVCPHRTCGAAQVSGGTHGQVSRCPARTAVSWQAAGQYPWYPSKAKRVMYENTRARRKLMKVPMMMYSTSFLLAPAPISPNRRRDFAAMRKPIAEG